MFGGGIIPDGIVGGRAPVKFGGGIPWGTPGAGIRGGSIPGGGILGGSIPWGGIPGGGIPDGSIPGGGIPPGETPDGGPPRRKSFVPRAPACPARSDCPAAGPCGPRPSDGIDLAIFGPAPPRTPPFKYICRVYTFLSGSQCTCRCAGALSTSMFGILNAIVS